MERIVFTVLFGLMAISATFADMIKYDTTPGSVFNCVESGTLSGCGTGQVTLGNTILLTYVPAQNSSVEVILPGMASSNAQFGNIVITCVDRTTSCNSQSIVGLTLRISIHQLLPNDLTGFIPDATISGTIGGGSSAALIQWNQGTSVDLAGANLDNLYSIQNTTLGLVAPAAGGTTTIQALIQAAAGTPRPNDAPLSSVPEPAISLLLAGGLVAMGTVGRRK